MASNKNAWIGFWAVIIGAVIAGLFLLGNSLIQKPQATTAIQQKNDSGINNSAGKDLIQAGRDNIKTNGPVNENNYYGDTSKKKPIVRAGSSGDRSINVTSYDQHGGMTVGQVIVIKNATFLQTGEGTTAADASDNYSCVIDAGNKRITIQPKTGEWKTPFVAFPNQELSSIGPHFYNATKSTINVDIGSYSFNGQNLFGLSTNTLPSTAHLSYSLHYQALPTKIIFGNYPAPLYETTLTKR
jgi:hypothetical protein